MHAKSEMKSTFCKKLRRNMTHHQVCNQGVQPDDFPHEIFKNIFCS